MLTNNTIIIDLDGTLLNKNKIIQDEDLKTLKFLSKYNSIIIASGRHYLEIEELLKLYELNDIVEKLIICRNGQIIYDIKGKKIIQNITINYNELAKIIHELESNNIYWYLIQGNQLFCKRIKYNCLKYADNGKYTINVISDISELKDYSIEKFIINSNNLEELQNIEKKLKNDFNIDFFKIEREKKYNNKVYWQNNILPNNTNKYIAAQYIIQKLKLSKNIIAFGDGVNDYELLINSDIGICMEHSCQELKNISNFVTKSNNGFSFAIEKLIKKRYYYLNISNLYYFFGIL